MRFPNEEGDRIAHGVSFGKGSATSRSIVGSEQYLRKKFVSLAVDSSQLPFLHSMDLFSVFLFLIAARWESRVAFNFTTEPRSATVLEYFQGETTCQKSN